MGIELEHPITAVSIIYEAPFMRALKPRRGLNPTFLERLETRAMMSAGVEALTKFSAALVPPQLTPAEIRVVRDEFQQSHGNHHVPRPRPHFPMLKHQPTHAQRAGHAPQSVETPRSPKNDAVPGVESSKVAPLKARGWNFWLRHRRQLNRGLGSGGSSAGGGSGITGTPAPAVPSQTMTPSMIRHAYGFDQLTLTGAGQTIAIVDAYDDPNIETDLAVFSQKFGLPNADFTKVVASTGTPAFNASWAYEIALDVEWAHAIAPGAKIVLVEAASASYPDLLKAVDTAVGLGANIVSMSWGGGESASDVANNAHFNHPGVTFTAAAGDAGKGTLGPSSSPYVVAVGGTTLSTDPLGNRMSETAWSGSGGGVSTYQSRPNYQLGFNPSNHRASPDVSYDASPTTGFQVYNSTGYGWAVVAGTSAGAPQWAGLFALVNQGRAQIGRAPIGNGLQYGVNNALYALAGGSKYTNAGGNFHDVSIGGNGYGAGPGYDLVTGLGSPAANRLIPSLINF